MPLEHHPLLTIEGLQNLDPSSALTTFEQGDILSHNTWSNTGSWFLRTRSNLVAAYKNQEIYSNPNPDGWLVGYCFTSRSKFFHLHGDVTITGEGLQNLGLCSALRAFELGGIFIVPHLLWQPGLIRRIAPFSRLLRHTKGWGESILTRIFTGPHSRRNLKQLEK
jgi:hypothetical protein